MVCEALWQSMQPKIKDANHENEQNENCARYNHERVRLTGSGHEPRQIAGKNLVN